MQENYPEYDSIILDEGGDIGYDGENYVGKVEGRGESILVFNPNQIKNIDNLNPTTDNDIRYSVDNSNNMNYNTLENGGLMMEEIPMEYKYRKELMKAKAKLISPKYIEKEKNKLESKENFHLQKKTDNLPKD